MVRIDNDPATFVIKDANDIDCDGFANNDPLECEELVHLASRGASMGGVDDLVPETRIVTQQGNLPTCEIATTKKGCTDGILNTDVATTFDPHFCGSLEVCNIPVCGPGELFSCEAMEPIRCVTPYTTTNGAVTLCDAPFPLAPVDEWLSSSTCNDAAKVVVAVSASFDWRTEIEAAGVRYSLVSNGCTVTIKPSGVPDTIGVGGYLSTFVAIPVASAPDGAGIVLPLELELVNTGASDCPATPPGCTYLGNRAPFTLQALSACLDES